MAAAPTLAADCPRFDRVVSSDLRRARETAEVLAAALGIGTVVVDPRLREAHAGEWQGLTRAEIELRWPGWLDAGRRPPGFEPYDDAAARFAMALRDAARAIPGGHALVVSHGGVLRAARRQLGAPELRFPNLGGAWFTVVAATGELQAGAILLPLEAREGSVVE
jgi:broad specificity phosphatase PhoE